MRLIITIILTWLLLNHMIYLVSAESVTIGMADRFQKQSRSYQEMAFRMVFDQSYNVSHVGFFPYGGAKQGIYAAYVVSDDNGNPNMGNVLASNLSFNPVDVVVQIGYGRGEVRIPQYTVQPNTTYWAVFEYINGTPTGFGHVYPYPSVNFDTRYTAKHWDSSSSSWVVDNAAPYGVVWVKTDTGLVYGQFKIRRSLSGYVGWDSKYNTSRRSGQVASISPDNKYIIDKFQIWLEGKPPEGQDNLYLTIEDLDNNLIVWTGSIGNSSTIPIVNNDYTYVFNEPKPVIENTSKIRFYLSSPGTNVGSYQTNSIEFYSPRYSFDAEQSYGVATDSVGAWVPNTLEDLQAHLVASTPSSSFCGDSTCNGAETCSSCAIDCGACPSGNFDNNPNQFWVRTDGSDSCNGQNNMSYSESSTDCAWRTIQKAASTIASGQTARMQAGNYGNETVIIANLGTTFQADGQVVLENNYAGTAVSFNGKSSVTIQGFTIKRYSTGIWYESSPGTRIINNTVSESAGASGIVNRYSGNTLIENNTVFNSGVYNIYVYRSNNVTLRNNIVYNDWTIAQSNPDTTSDYGFRLNEMTNSYSENNVAYNHYHNWRLRHSTQYNVFNNDISYGTNGEGYGFEFDDNVSHNTFNNILIDGQSSTYPSNSRPAFGIKIAYLSSNNTFNNITVRNMRASEGTGAIISASYHSPTECGYNILANENTATCDYPGVFKLYESVNNKFTNSTFENMSYGIRFFSPHNSVSNLKMLGILLNNYWEDIGINTTIIDPPESFTVKFNPTNDSSTLNVVFTDNSVFNHTKGNGTWYPSQSNLFVSKNTENVVVNIYPITVRPLIGSATAAVNRFDDSLPKGNILVNLTVDTTNGNSVAFAATLKPYAKYLIKKDNANFTILQADSTGKITFNNSAW